MNGGCGFWRATSASGRIGALPRTPPWPVDLGPGSEGEPVGPPFLPGRTARSPRRASWKAAESGEAAEKAIRSSPHPSGAPAARLGEPLKAAGLLAGPAPGC